MGPKEGSKGFPTSSQLTATHGGRSWELHNQSWPARRTRFWVLLPHQQPRTYRPYPPAWPGAQAPARSPPPSSLPPAAASLPCPLWYTHLWKPSCSPNSGTPTPLRKHVWISPLPSPLPLIGYGSPRGSVGRDWLLASHRPSCVEAGPTHFKRPGELPAAASELAVLACTCTIRGQGLFLWCSPAGPCTTLQGALASSSTQDPPFSLLEFWSPPCRDIPGWAPFSEPFPPPLSPWCCLSYELSCS